MILLIEASGFWCDLIVQLLGSIVGAFLGFVLAIWATNLTERKRQRDSDVLLLHNLCRELEQLYDKEFDVKKDLRYSAIMVACLSPTLNSQSILNLIMKNDKNIFDLLKSLELKINNINSWYKDKSSYYVQAQFKQINTPNQSDIEESEEYKVYVNYIDTLIKDLKSKVFEAKKSLDELLLQLKNKKDVR